MSASDDQLTAPRWARLLAVAAPVVSWPVGLVMSVQWGVGGGRTPGDLPAAVRWMPEALPVFGSAGGPVEAWPRLYFAVVLAALPFAWRATRRATAAPRWLVRAGLAVAAGATALEYNTAAGYGWPVDVAALLVALAGTVWYGVQALRRAVLPRRAAWALVAALPLTPVAGVLGLGYLPPALALGTLVAWALTAAAWGPPQASAPSSPAPSSAASSRFGATAR